jgi:hypothetical protein
VADRPAPRSTPPADAPGGAGELTFGLAPVLRARLMGVALAGLGLLLVVVSVLVFAVDLPIDVLSLVVVLVLVGVFVLGFLLSRRWYVVRLDPDGYRIRFVRGAGVTSARWADVHDMVTATVGGPGWVGRRLRDGRCTTLPVDLVEGDPEELVRELGRRLAAAHGGRRPR